MSKFGNIGSDAAKQVEQLLGSSREKWEDALGRTSPYDFFSKLKNLDDSIAKDFYMTFKKRWSRSEDRIKEIENSLKDLQYDDMSLEEGRFEILCELLDKACQGFNVFDEHKDRRIPYGHRLVLEARLLKMINDSFDLIQSICDEFDVLRSKKDDVDRERDTLRLEIRLCDLRLTEIHECMLKSYLEMEW